MSELFPQTRLFLYFAVAAIATIILVAYFASTQAEKSLRASVQDRLRMVAELKVNLLSQWVDEQQDNVILLASLPELRTLSEARLDPASVESDRLHAQVELTRLVTLIAQRDIDIRDIQILDQDGVIVVSVFRENVSKSQADQPFFLEGKTGVFAQGFYKSDLFGKFTLTVSAPLFNDLGKQAGVFGVHFNLRRRVSRAGAA